MSRSLPPRLRRTILWFWLLAALPLSARADLDGLPPTVIERVFLWKFNLLTDQDDPKLYLVDGETELMIRVITRQGAHEVVYWDLINAGINMDDAAQNFFPVIDGTQSPSLGHRQYALTLLHDACYPFDAPRVEIDAWEVDIDNIGPFLNKLGTVMGITGLFIPEVAPAGAALTGVGKIFEILGNDQEHLGSSKHGFPAPWVLPPLEVGETALIGTPNYSYSFKFERDTVDFLTCREGDAVAIALSRLDANTTLPPERDWLRAIIAGLRFAHPFTQNYGILESRVTDGLPELLNFVDGLRRENGTVPVWLKRQMNHVLSQKIRMHHGVNDAIQLGGFLSDVGTFVLKEKYGSCWPDVVPPGLVRPAPAERIAFDDATSSDGLRHWAMVDSIPGMPPTIELVEVLVRDGVPERIPIESFACPGCDQVALIADVAMVAGPSDELHAVYLVRLPDGSEVLKYAKKGPSGWQVTTLDDTPGRRFSVPLNLLIDAQGRPQVGYGATTPGIEGQAEVLHCIFENGDWTRELVSAPLMGGKDPPRCRMALDANSKAHFAFTGRGHKGTIRPPREGDFVSSASTVVTLLYSGPPMSIGSATVVDQDYTGGEKQAPLIDVDITGEPRIVYAEQNGPMSELRHHQRVAQSVWISERVDSSLTPIQPVGFAVDEDGRSNIVYTRDGPEPELAGLPSRTMLAMQWLPGGGYMSPSGPPPDSLSIVPGDDDPASCSWRWEIKDEILRLTRESLTTEISESILNSGNPSRRILSQADLAVGDSYLASHDHMAAVARYGAGIRRLAIETHGDAGHTLTGPPLDEITRPRMLMIRSTPDRGGLHVLFQVATRELVQIDLFDLQGRRIGRLVNEVMEPGAHSRQWFPPNGELNGLPSGIHFARMSTPSGEDRRNVVVLH